MEARSYGVSNNSILPSSNPIYREALVDPIDDAAHKKSKWITNKRTTIREDQHKPEHSQPNMLATLLLVVALLLSSVVAEEAETRNLRKRTNYYSLRTDLHNWIDDLTNSELLDAEDCMLYGDTSTRSSTRTGDVSFYCLRGGQECWSNDDCMTRDVCDFSGPICR